MGSCGLGTVNLLWYLLAIALFVGFCIAGLFGYVCRGRNALLLIRFFTARGQCMGYQLSLFVCSKFQFPVNCAIAKDYGFNAKSAFGSTRDLL